MVVGVNNDIKQELTRFKDNGGSLKTTLLPVVSMVASKVKSPNVCNFGSGKYTLVIIRAITGWGRNDAVNDFYPYKLKRR